MNLVFLVPFYYFNLQKRQKLAASASNKYFLLGAEETEIIGSTPEEIFCCAGENSWKKDNAANFELLCSQRFKKCHTYNSPMDPMEMLLVKSA